MTTEFDEEEDDSKLPRLHAFLKELANWLGLAAICMFLIYAVLFVVYEIALDLTQVRWAFTGFLACCAVDVISLWICRYAVSDAGGSEVFLIWLGLFMQISTGLYYLIAPIIILTTYRFSPEQSMKAGEEILEQNKEKHAHTLEDYVDPDPCRKLSKNNEEEPLWQCGYVDSIKTAAMCMWISVAPKILVCYLLVRILKKLRR